MDPAIEQHFTDELKADPVVSQFYEKGDYKTVPDIMKGLAHSQKRLGSVVPLLNGDAKPEDIEGWRKEHLPKLINAKLIDAPRQAPEKYTIKRPEGLPEGAWNEGLEGKFAEVAKKHGFDQAAVDELMGLYVETFGEFGKAVAVDRQAMAGKIKEWADAEGVSLEEIDAALDRFNKDPNGWDAETAELVSKSGYADNPLVVKAIYKLIKDSGLMDTRDTTGSGDGQTSAEEAEILDAMRIQGDDKHPDYAKYNTKEWETKIDAYWKKKAGSAQYVIS